MINHRNHRNSRRQYRYTTRILSGRRPRKPNDLALAIKCISTYIRMHKRLAKLYPEYFDYALIDRRRREEQERQVREKEFQRILDKVYGTNPPAINN